MTAQKEKRQNKNEWRDFMKKALNEVVCLAKEKAQLSVIAKKLDTLIKKQKKYNTDKKQTTPPLS